MNTSITCTGCDLTQTKYWISLKNAYVRMDIMLD